MKHKFLASVFVGLCFTSNLMQAQFSPSVGQLGTTAMYKDSSAFVAWANKCQIVRGFQDISNQSLGYANFGDSSLAIGPADGSGIVSLGDGGIAILEFASPIRTPENTADENELKELRLLNPMQIANLIIYRNLFGKFINIYELQAVPGWNIELIQKIRRYITVNEAVVVTVPIQL